MSGKTTWGAAPCPDGRSFAGGRGGRHLRRLLRKIYLFQVFNSAGNVVPTCLPHCGSVFALIESFYCTPPTLGCGRFQFRAAFQRLLKVASRAKSPLRYFTKIDSFSVC